LGPVLVSVEGLLELASLALFLPIDSISPEVSSLGKHQPPDVHTG